MTKKEYDELTAKIRRYNEAYEAAEPEVSDYEYDMLMQSLKAAEREHPEWKTKESPTQKVGASVKRTGGVTVEHNVPMLSIEDVFTKEDVVEWVRDVRSKVPGAKFCVEHKIDGLSMTLRYEGGKMVLAETRGDGYVGEDVTVNALVIDDVIADISPYNESVELRGEVYMTREAFEAVNEKQELLGKKIFANPRNCASGTLRQLDTAVTKDRKLSFFVFNVQRSSHEALMRSQSEGLKFISEKLGIKTVPSRLCSTEEEIIAEIDSIGETRGDLPYDIDGAVVKLDEISLRENFPSASKYSPGHIAYKYPPEEKETVIRDIEISVGMTGKLNPTAVFDPIRLCGTTVSRATLHNQDFIDKLHIGIGDTVVVYKSGEIIPRIKASVPEKRPKGGHDFVMPDTCPVCGSKVIRDEGMSDIRCGSADCPAQAERHLINFAGRDAMDIKGLGSELIAALYKEGYLGSVADIYTLREKRDELIEKGITGREKNTDKVLAAIEGSKEKEPSRILTGLAIPNVGKTTAGVLIRHFGSIEKLAKATEEELTQVDDVGGITAACIREWFDEPVNAALIERLKELGLKMEADTSESSAELAGETYVITGDLQHFENRNALTEFITQRGGKVSGSVSSKTTALINNDAASTSGKNKKARELGIPVITEDEFMARVEARKE